MNLKPLNLDRIRPLRGFSVIDESKLANVEVRLDREPVHVGTYRRSFETLERSRKCSRQLGRLPEPGEAIHCVLNGSYALFEFIPAIIDLGKTPIDRLDIATLGFSRKNIDALVGLEADGLLAHVRMLCSHYFSAADSEIYDHALEAFAPSKWQLLPMRTHSKLLLIQSGKSHYTVESSANLRSCHNVEQATIINDPNLYHFHRQWIDTLFTKGQKP